MIIAVVLTYERLVLYSELSTCLFTSQKFYKNVMICIPFKSESRNNTNGVLKIAVQ